MLGGQSFDQPMCSFCPHSVCYHYSSALSSDKYQNNTVCVIIILVHSDQTNIKITQCVLSLF